MILYIGPLKVKCAIKLIESLFVLVSLEDGQTLGYPVRSSGHAYLAYELSSLPPITQAQIRTRKNWDALLIWDNGEIWRSEYAYYEYSCNLICTMLRAKSSPQH